MNSIKKIAALVLTVCMVTVMLSGCTSTPEGKALYDAMIKSQAIKSAQSDMQFTLRFDASGLTEEEEAGLAQMKAMLNGTKLHMNMKQATNADNTVTKAAADVNMELGGMAMNMGVWVDMDLNGSTPKFKEIIKLPAILTAMDPNMAGKEYMIMDFADLTFGSKNDADYAGTLKLTKELQAKTVEFLGKYMAQYEPGFKYISDAGTRDIKTPEGTVKAHVYQVRLDDKAAKKLIRYTVNNFANNKDAMEFAVEYMKFIQKFAVPTPGVGNPAAELDKLMADYEKEKPAMLEEFNKAMDELENIKLVGDKGILIEYAIDEKGYVVSQSGSMDFVIEPAKLDKIGNNESSEPASQAVYYVGFDFSALTYNINKELNIEFPAVTSENSINYNDMLSQAGGLSGSETAPAQAQAPALKAVPTASKVLVNGKVTSFDAYTINGNNYFKLRDLAKVVSGTKKQFEVTWDGERKAINLISNKAYTVVGGELAAGDGKEKTPEPNTSKIYKDGVEIPLTAYTINGNNYFKLRDIAQAFNIGVTWDGATKTVGIDTNIGYTAP